jgi:hypothetical protein
VYLKYLDNLLKFFVFYRNAADNFGKIIIIFVRDWGHGVAQWLRHCATNRKVTGSIPDGVIGIFH